MNKGLPGGNDQVSDHIETVNGVEILGSASQMKIVSDHEGLLKKIAQGKDGGKNDLSRYMDNDVSVKY